MSRKTSAAAEAPQQPATPALDRIQYLEAKLILRPDRFKSIDAFRDFGKIVKRIARRTEVRYKPPKVKESQLQVREVVFFDTPDYALYNNAFILRRRIRYASGFPEGDPEIVFKYRHPDEATAAAVDVRPNIEGEHRIKFKAEVLPLKDRAGGYRILYSHNVQFGLSQVREQDRTSIHTLDHVLPALTRLKRPGEERIKLVNEGIVEEVLLPLGFLDFGGGLKAKCDIGLWRTRGEHLPLVGEFAFQAKFDRKELVAQKQRDAVAAFYLALQHEVADWLALGVTKTGMVYRLKGAGVTAHE